MKKPIPGIVPEPATVTVIEEARIDWIAILILILCITGIIIGLCRSPSQLPPAETWPEAGPAAVFGVSQCPELDHCHVPTCPNSGFLARFVEALDAGAENPREIRDVLNRCYVESRFAPGIVSSTGDYGICQINQKAHPETDVERLLTDPEYAAGECLRVYRVFYRACGAEWQCCYRYGIKGCKGRVTATNKRSKK